MRPGQGLERIEVEIAREKAAALGRAGERLEHALAEVEAVRRQLDAATDGAARDRLGREYETVWHRAASARMALLIQREAFGLRHHRLVDHLFPEPPRLRQALGLTGEVAVVPPRTIPRSEGTAATVIERGAGHERAP